MKIHRSLLLLALPLIPACVSDPVTGRSKLSVVQWSPAEEVELGRESAPNIESQFDALYPDLDAQQRLRDIVMDMAAISARAGDFPFHFEILNSSTPNAFAIPGGFVYITRGLLQELETEGEFVSVLGHEIGHQEHQHSMMNQSDRSILAAPFIPFIAIGRALPIGGNLVLGATALVAAPSVLLGLSFSRDQESEADRRGVYFAAELGYDPREFNKVFELFQRMEEEAGADDQYAIFRTHPLNKDRVRGVEAEIAKKYPEIPKRPPESFRPTSRSFQSVLDTFHARKPAYQAYDRAHAALRTKDGNPPGAAQIDKAKRHLGRARSMISDEPLFLILEGELALLEEKFDAAESAFTQAHRVYESKTPGQGHWKSPYFLGTIALDQGDAREASRWLILAEARYPSNGVIPYALGLALEKTGDRGGAAMAFDRAIGLLPENSELYKDARRRRRALGDRA